MSVILRTSGINNAKEVIEGDMNYLVEIYENIIDKSVLKDAPYLVYEERVCWLESSEIILRYC
ncbi:MAG: hypothetical protein Ct9H90mP18_06780 [Gammaproteobacteria bacterium]|nr:MAG: hypothetical protein Ct9H90mP18_06780 [Gammaproteobacteria bacterium]